MNTHPKTTSIGVALLVTLLFTARSFSQSVVIPNVCTTTEGDAFTGALAVQMHQQEVYDYTQFPAAPILITEIRYRPDVQWGQGVGPFSTVLSRVQLRLSTTSKRAGELSYKFSQNVGNDERIVYDAAWTFATKYEGPLSGPKVFDITMPLQTPFLYDPAKGNLLVELRNYGHAPQVYVHDDSRYGNLMQRIFVENPDATDATSGDLSAAVMQVIYASQDSPPTILRQPGDVSMNVGDDATISVTAIGSQPLSYQWFFNSAPISTGTNQSLLISKASLTNEGDYYVAVSNSYGTTNSNVAHARVKVPPEAVWVVPTISATNEGDAYTGALSVPMRQQEIYAASQFPPSVVRISELRYRPDVQWGSTVGAFSTERSRVQLRLSTTTKSPGALEMQFDRNVGSDEVIVFDAPWTFTTQYQGPAKGPKAFDIIVSLQHDFLYDPSKGNLLVELRNYGAASVPVYVHDDARLAGTLQRIFVDNPTGDLATSSDLSAAVLQVGYSAAPSAPWIVGEPIDRAIVEGERLELNVEAHGTSPLTYQWWRDGSQAAVGDSTNFVIDHVAYGDAGGYFAVVSNALGVATSRVATVTIKTPPTLVRLLGSDVFAGGTLRLPVEVTAQGNENAIAFGLGFNGRLFEYVSHEVAPEFSDAFVQWNLNELGADHLGVVFALPSGASFKRGKSVPMTLVFKAAPIVASETTSLLFVDRPVPREVVDSGAKDLEGVFSGADVKVVFHGFEADVAPRPSGDNRVSLADWVQVGRFAAGLDDVGSPDEFQRVDCAPRSSFGDGRISVKDWVQAGRYAAGLDPATVVAGPTEQAPDSPQSSLTLQSSETSWLILGSASGNAGDIVSIPVSLSGTGTEVGIGFSVQFDPNQLGLVSVDKGRDTANGVMNVNTRLSAKGHVGVVIALGVTGRFNPGTNEVAFFRFKVGSVRKGTTSFVFSDNPVLRETVDSTASDVPMAYSPGNLIVEVGAPDVAIDLVHGHIEVSWPVAGTGGFVLERATGIDGALWVESDVVPDQVLDRWVAHLRLGDLPAYFRIRRP